MAISDFHKHYYPPAYVDALRAGPSAYTVTEDAEGNPVLHSPGDYNILVPGHRNIDVRKADLEKAGVDRHLLSFTAPGTLIETPERSVVLSRLVNDALATVQREHGDQFPALATLPLNDPEASVDELERAALLLPDASEVQNHLGLAYQAAGRSRDAEDAFRRAVELDCANDAATQNLGVVEASRPGDGTR